MKIFLSLCAALTLFAGYAHSQPIAWQKMALRSPDALKSGVSPGGEGSQWPRYNIEISRTEPDFMLLPIDVGGLFRSTDGGAHWNLSLNGWNARGANSFAIDPRNSSRVLGVGGNSLDWNADWGQSPHGVYLSTDKAQSWQQTLAVTDGFLTHVSFDASSFDADFGGCKVAYYASYSRGLFRSQDGGKTWNAVSRLPIDLRLEEQVPALLKVHPTRGTVFLSGKGGLFASDDGGKTFEKRFDGDIWGVSLVEKSPDEMWISGSAGLLVSKDGGRTFSPLEAKGIERKTGEAIRNINVSPADPKRMLCWVAGEGWRWVRYVSHDGGASFSPIQIEIGSSGRDVMGDSNARVNAKVGGWATLPYNVRNGWFGWHPTDPDIVMGIGGDWATKSLDGGRNFAWSNNGNNGVMLGQSLNFSAHDPNTVFLAFQDYNGAFSTDGGQSWTYRDVSGKGWGGHCYGGFAVDKNVMWYGDSENWGPPRRTRISRDGGQSWNDAKTPEGGICEWSGAEISYCDPKNPNILFASCWRSTDKGVSWAKMSDCDGVYISAPDGTLIGRKDSAIVTSKDAGNTWKNTAQIEGGFRDVAFDHTRNRFYVVSQERLKMWENGKLTTLETPRDQYGSQRVECVALDPKMPQTVYGGGPKNLYLSAATVFRSTDAGQTWENLTTSSGPREVAAMRVNPKTRELWLNGQCYGMWRLAAPTTLGAAPQTLANAQMAPKIALAVGLPDDIAKPVPVQNGDMSAGAQIPDGWNEKWGEIGVARDTQTFKSAPASLRADANGKSGQAFQMWNVEGGGTYAISGWMKTAGEVKAQIAVQSFSGDWGKNEFSQIRFYQGQSDWTQFAKEVKIPDWAGRFNLQLMVEGMGQAWLDDVQVVAKGAAPTTAQPIVQRTAQKGETVTITNILRDFGGLDYIYGPKWNNENVREVDGNLRLDTTEAGGGGIVLNGANLTPQKQTHLALRARKLDGNGAGNLNLNIMRDAANGGTKTVSLDLSGLEIGNWKTLVAPLGEGDFSRVLQLQLQGTNWSEAAAPLKIEIAQIGTTSLDEKANAAAELAAQNDPTHGPAAKVAAAPTVAGHGFWADYPQAWLNVHRGFVERTKSLAGKNQTRVVFLGDSITQGWNEAGKSSWEKNYAPLGAQNYAIGGDSTRQTLFHLQNGVLDGLNPKVVVLRIGTNNLYSDNNAGSDEEIVAGTHRIIELIRQKAPAAKVLLLDLLPRQHDYFLGRIKNINVQLAKLDDGKTVRFLSMSQAFSTPQGQPNPAFFVGDLLHLNEKGYELNAEQTKVLLGEMLK